MQEGLFTPLKKIELKLDMIKSKTKNRTSNMCLQMYLVTMIKNKTSYVVGLFLNEHEAIELFDHKRNRNVKNDNDNQDENEEYLVIAVPINKEVLLEID